MGLPRHFRPFENRPFWTNGLSAERLLEQIETIRKINASKEHKIRLFAGLECDILSDGSLDFPRKLLGKARLCDRLRPLLSYPR